MNLLPALPVIIPFSAAAAAFLVRGSPTASRAAALAGGVGLLAAGLLLMRGVATSGPQVLQLGGWPAPFGITMIADHLSSLLVSVTGFIGVAAMLSTLAEPASLEESKESFGLHSLLLILLGGVCGAFLTGDLFNMYVWFEVMVVASFGLFVLGGDARRLDGAIRYVTINLVSTSLLLSAIGLLYGLTGSLNLAELRGLAAAGPSALTAVAVLFLVALGLKAALFPLFFWLPASYPTLPSPVSAVFAGLLTKVGVYACLRLFTLVFVGEEGWLAPVLLGLALATMLVGPLCALAQGEMGRMLAFQIIGHIGYMILGLALFTPLALAGAIFYMVHHMVVKAGLFLLAGLVRQTVGHTELAKGGGLFAASPVLSGLFLVSALSIAGLPPFSGFWGKLVLVRASLEAGQYAAAGMVVAASAVTVLAMMKLWDQVFWKPAPTGAVPPELPEQGRVARLAPVVMCVGLTTLLGLWAAPLMDWSMLAAQGLLDPAPYVRAVLEGRP